jgi:hypothetical protein
MPVQEHDRRPFTSAPNSQGSACLTVDVLDVLEREPIEETQRLHDALPTRAAIGLIAAVDPGELCDAEGFRGSDHAHRQTEHLRVVEANVVPH